MTDTDTALPGGEAMMYREAAHLPVVRAFVHARACALGLARQRADRLTLAVSELVTNTLQHSRGGGRVRIWAGEGRLTCEVADGGSARTFGREMPAPEALGGRGLAIVERMCDEVTSVAVPGGTVVRLRFAL
jgi:anti-sigma regulatory factor (Ser/Thr protein kinase)